MLQPSEARPPPRPRGGGAVARLSDPLLGAPAQAHHRHNHEGNLCSGVFYASLPAAGGVAPLVFDDPRGVPWADVGAATGGAGGLRLNLRDEGGLPGGGGGPSSGALRAPFIEQRVFSPREGDLIIFPAWLPHAVVSGEAAGGGAAGKASGGLDASTARIAFAFNLECPAALASFAFSV